MRHVIVAAALSWAVGASLSTLVIEEPMALFNVIGLAILSPIALILHLTRVR